MAVAGLAPGAWPFDMVRGRPAIDLCEGCKWELARWLRMVSTITAEDLAAAAACEVEWPPASAPRWLKIANGG
jgi:hypothetical protein